MANYDIAYARTAGIEGGFAILADGKGYTYCGITYLDNPQWQGWNILLPLIKAGKVKRGDLFVQGPLPGLVKEFYRTEYWNKIVNGAALQHQAVADFAYDFAVNSKYKAVEKINIAASKVTPGTLEASKYKIADPVANVLNTNAEKAYSAMYAERRAFYDANRSSPYYNGWINRLNSFPASIKVAQPAPAKPAQPAPAPAPVKTSTNFFTEFLKWLGL